MNYQQNRNNLNPYNSQPIFRPIYTQLQNNSTTTNQQYYIERQQNNINNFSNGNLNLKGYSFEGKQFYRPQQVIANTPLSFNVHTPLRAKGGKKTSRPFEKITKSVINNTFTKQLQDQFTKKQQIKEITTLDDFSKTTSTVMGQSFFKQQTNYTQPQQYGYKKQQGYHNKSLENIGALDAFVKRGETQSKIFDNYTNYNSVSAVNYQSQSNREKSLQKNRNNFFQEVAKLNKEIKHLKDQNNVKDKAVKETNTLLELQYQKTNKLLTQIEEMEKELRGSQELNRFLQRQCNMYLQNYNKIKIELDKTNSTLNQENSKHQQIVKILKKQIQQLQTELSQFKDKDLLLKEQITNLKKTIKYQQQKIQQKQTNSKIDVSQMNILKTKLQNLQTKYEKLMLNHCDNQIKFHNNEQIFNKNKLQWENQCNRMVMQINGLKQREERLQYVNNQKLMEIWQLKEEFSRVNNENSQAKRRLQQKCTFFQRELQSVNLQLSTNKQAFSKMQSQLSKTNNQLSHKNEYSKRLQNQIQLLIQQSNSLITQNKQIKKQNQQTKQIIMIINQQKFTLQQQCNRMDKLLQQKQLFLQQYSKEIQNMKFSSNKLEIQSIEINKRHESILNNYNVQVKNYKELQAQLIQNQFDYNILQRDFNQYTHKYQKLNEECRNLKQLNQNLQSQYSSLHICHQSSLKIINELEEKYQQSLSHQIEIKEKLLQTEKQKDDIQKLIEINKKLYESSSNELNKNNQNLLHQRSILKQRINDFKEDKQKQQKLRQQSDLLLKQQISSLMLIIQQNQERSLLQRNNYKTNIQFLHNQIKQNQQDQQQYQSNLSISKQLSQKYKQQMDNLLLNQQSLRKQLQQKDNIIFQLQLKINQSKSTQITQDRQFQSSTELPTSNQLMSPIKLRQYDSQTDLKHSQQINYIQMDAQGIFFLCQLLQIDSQDGNILNKIVSKIQTLLSDVSQSRKTLDSYRKLLDVFSIQNNECSDDILLHEITTIKENLAMVIQKLKEEQCMHQALKKQYYHLIRIKQSEQFKHQMCIDQLFHINLLNQELNQNVFKLTATICNQKIKIIQAINLAKQGVMDVKKKDIFVEVQKTCFVGDQYCEDGQQSVEEA